MGWSPGDQSRNTWVPKQNHMGSEARSSGDQGRIMRGIKEDHLGTKVGVDTKSALHWAVAQTTVQEDRVTAQNADVTPQ